MATNFKTLPWRSETYKAWVRSLPCLTCGIQPAGNAHHENEIMKGTMGGKCGDDRCLPLCGVHHAERHSQGRSFWAGYDAMSCDFLATEVPGPHYQGDCRDILNAEEWDLLIAHPDCTYLTCSAEWAYGDGPYHQKVKPETLVGAARREAREQALDFVRLLLASRAKRKCLENPAIGAINTRIRKPDQIIQPHQFGHDASKATGLWLEDLPPLVPTCHIPPRMVNGRPRWANQTDSGQNKLTPGPDRWKERARTYDGWSNAMADQWGRFLRQSTGDL